jgi:hypothetical protein
MEHVFRLYDFNVYNKKSEAKEESGSDEDSGAKSDANNFVIQMFGINEKGETCAVTVDDFNPFFFIKVGDDWTERNRVIFMKDLQDRLKRDFNGILDSFLVDYNKLYGFSSGKKSRSIESVQVELFKFYWTLRPRCYKITPQYYTILQQIYNKWVRRPRIFYNIRGCAPGTDAAPCGRVPTTSEVKNYLKASDCKKAI